ncbi:MAG: serine/threonine protein kinase, partial [Deltaproteobacteria bacterium]|nr:serine/threonine protein kinase [Deltaproteobacteria bacterium]
MEALAGGRGTELVLLHEINAGTFARLYLAEARASGGIDRIVAVKILREQWNEQQEVVARTRDEARLLARLRHKNILRVEELVEVDGQTAIIMEYVDGLDLKQLVEALNQRRQRLPCKVALHIACEAASALEAAYFRVPTGLDKPLRVVHRDIKPSNIMVSTEGEVRVLDFGTARSSAVFRSAQTGALRFGSLKYMSPERREGDRGEHPSDVYALGLVLLELLRTEWLPLFPMDVQEHDEATASAIARLDGLGMPNREWDMALRQALAQMLASDPRARPSAEQVVKLMREFVEQSQGPLMGRFAEEVVAPIAEEHARARPQAGSLAGTRLVVNAVGEGPRPVSMSNQGGGPTASRPAAAAPAVREAGV